MKLRSNHSPISRIAFVGNYLPRQCGIATFTTDLCEAIATEHSETTCIALPVNDIDGGYPYPSAFDSSWRKKILSLIDAPPISSISTMWTWFACNSSMGFLAGAQAVTFSLSCVNCACQL